jgi:tripartite-type tricarboxylate transporter receptor subunit TctC
MQQAKQAVQYTWAVAAGLIAMFPVAQSAGAADAAWPEKSIRLIVPFAPGAAADMFGRLVGQKLGESLGHQTIVDNRAGGGAVVGTEMVAKAPPDGYTLLLTTPAFVINATGIRTLPYNTQKDFAPISLFASTAMIIVSNPELPIRTMKDLIELAKKSQGKLTFGSAGNGSINQLGMELLGLQAAKMTHVPYKGGAPALADVAGGRVDVMLSTVIAAQPLMKAGRLRPIAVTTPARSTLMPDVPTVAETLPGFESINWAGLVAPGGTPAPVVARLNAVLVKALREPEVKERLAREGAEPVGNSPREFEAFIRNEIVKWTRVVKETGATVD